MKKINTTLIILITFISTAYTQKSDSLSKKQNFELSFGQTILFISDSKQINIHSENAVVVPTSAILFFTEFRPQQKMRIPVFFSLPTESKQFLINGKLINEKASPTFGTGLMFKTFQLKIDSKSKIEFEVGSLSSFIFDTKNKVRVAPVLAGRFRILRGENFVMYIGASYSIGINAFGLLYGTGTVF